MKINISVIVIITCLLFMAGTEDVHGDDVRGAGFSVSGLGITGDYAKTESTHDGGVYLSYRFGLHHMLSAFINMDVGYRFNEGSVNGKIGLLPMFFVIGLEFGFAYAYRVNDSDDPFSPGGYFGLSVLLPYKQFPVFVSIGGNFYGKGHENEFYAGATVLYNFWD
ncbi:MAG: hypothetical protein GY754_07535 [bacterium]|nr:hypothetical protein [bacterium]